MSIKALYHYCMNYNSEHKALLKLMAQYNGAVLDIGCGYGRNLKALIDQGFNVLGVEKNIHIVDYNKKVGLPCVSVDEFKAITQKFDVILMSHIIEHFQPADLLDFLNFYLDRLKLGGVIIIATPLSSPYFYDDFDHVKPYHPDGILMVFGEEAQVQYVSHHKLSLQSLWFRKSPYRISHVKAKYLKTRWTKIVQIIDFIFFLLYWVGLRRRDGWIGVFQKNQDGIKKQ